MFSTPLPLCVLFRPPNAPKHPQEWLQLAQALLRTYPNDSYIQRAARSQVQKLLPEAIPQSHLKRSHAPNSTPTCSKLNTDMLQIQHRHVFLRLKFLKLKRVARYLLSLAKGERARGPLVPLPWHSQCRPSDECLRAVENRFSSIVFDTMMDMSRVRVRLRAALKNVTFMIDVSPPVDIWNPNLNAG